MIFFFLGWPLCSVKVYFFNILFVVVFFLILLVFFFFASHSYLLWKQIWKSVAGLSGEPLIFLPLVWLQPSTGEGNKAPTYSGVCAHSTTVGMQSLGLWFRSTNKQILLWHIWQILFLISRKNHSKLAFQQQPKCKGSRRKSIYRLPHESET